MINHVVHKEKAKKEIIDLIKKMRRPNYIVTDSQLEQQIELIFHHMYRFVFNKLSKNVFSNFEEPNKQQPNTTNSKKQNLNSEF